MSLLLGQVPRPTCRGSGHMCCALSLWPCGHGPPAQASLLCCFPGSAQAPGLLPCSWAPGQACSLPFPCSSGLRGLGLWRGPVLPFSACSWNSLSYPSSTVLEVGTICHLAMGTQPGGCLQTPLQLWVGPWGGQGEKAP